jgi:penicillin-binding protein 2
MASGPGVRRIWLRPVNAYRLLSGVLAALMLAGCSGLVAPLPTTGPPPTASVTPSTPDPEGTAATFLDAWQRGDYDGMYSLLSPLSQDATSLVDFKARYQSLVTGASLKSVAASVLAVLKNGASAQVQYEVDLHTALVGTITRKIQMPLVYVDGRWAISWSDGLILPELAGGGTLNMQHTVPARANIYDRNGLGLAVQGDAVAVGVQPGQITDEPAVLAALSELLGISADTIKQKYANAHPDWYVPIGEVSAEEMQPRLADLTKLGGIILTRYSTRFYPNGGVAPQVIGVLGGISPERLADYRTRGYTGDERVGQSGLEAWGEQYLAGVRGGTLYAVAPGGETTKLAESAAQPAQAIYTTLDRALQRQVQEALGSFRGSVIVMNPSDGEVLAMASSPEFDPNLFDPTNRNSAGLSAVLQDGGKPLLNRATQGAYPPGSVFKVAMMGAALLSGLYNKDSMYTCTGTWNLLGPTAVKYDWTVTFGVKPHGPINLEQALSYSCDNYFYTVAYDLYQQNPDYMSQVARQFGLGEFTQVGQVAEARGLMPDPAWKQATYGETWTPGDSVNMGVGQGFVLVTPIQIAQMLSAIRNGGTLYRPQLVARVAPPDGQSSYKFQPIVNGHLPVTAEQLDLIRQGLDGAVNLPSGTAHFVFPNFVVPVAGKTGTAEDPAGGGPHAWFAGYTEANRTDKPDIAIVVMVENIGEGSLFAAPIFKRIAEDYFLGRPYTLYPWESEFGNTATPTPTPVATPKK